MACASVLRIKLRPLSSPRLRVIHQDLTFRRSFLSLPGSEIVTLTESRVLPYKSTSLYALISDVDRYATFLPYCQQSRVTKWSAPDKKGRKWPEEADLKIGWGGYEETFTSKLYCIPDTIVEALGGDAVTTLPEAQLKHHGSSLDSPATSNAIFKRMSTRWTVTPLHHDSNQSAHDQTEVHLRIEFQFSNPIYGALSKAVAPKLAEVMIEAFEKKAKLSLDTSDTTKERGPPQPNPLDKVFGR